MSNVRNSTPCRPLPDLSAESAGAELETSVILGRNIRHEACGINNIHIKTIHARNCVPVSFPDFRRRPTGNYLAKPRLPDL